MKKFSVITRSLIMAAFWYASAFAETPGEVKISYHNGAAYLVSDFSLYTNHEPVSGTYIKNTIDRVQPLPVHTGKLWHPVRGSDVATIRLEPEAGKKRLMVLIELKSGGTVSGIAPLEPSKTWDSGDYFWIQGLTTRFGNPARFKVKLDDLALVETVKGSQNQIVIKTRKGDEKTVQAVEFGLYGSMPYPSPISVGPHGTVRLDADGLVVDVPLDEIRGFTFDIYGEMSLTMRNGETGKAAFIGIRRFFGRLKTGEILFENIPTSEGDPIKSIEFPKTAPESGH